MLKECRVFSVNLLFVLNKGAYIALRQAKRVAFCRRGDDVAAILRIQSSYNINRQIDGLSNLSKVEYSIDGYRVSGQRERLLDKFYVILFMVGIRITCPNECGDISACLFWEIVIYIPIAPLFEP